jgi:Mu-like prophage tail sheath protein gpL
VSDYAADRIENAVIAAYPNKNIAPDPTNYIAPPTADVIYPSMVRATILAELDAMEREGLIVDVAANRDGVQVEQNASNKTLVVGVIPTRVIPHFHAFAGELQQLA